MQPAHQNIWSIGSFAVEATQSAAQAAVDQAAWRLGQKTVAAPVAGQVFDVLYQPGEWVAAGRPVVRLLPPGKPPAQRQR